MGARGSTRVIEPRPAGLRAAGFAVLLGVLASAFVCSGCASIDELDARMTQVHVRLERVLSAGAYACAPRELALARAELEFARAELSQGNPSRASNHLGQAELNVGAAELLSPPERCASGAARPALPVAEGETDADLDGVDDAADLCPDEVEDRDGYLDGDGCLDADNDGDGIEDLRDRCPQEAEDRDGFRDDDGCPDPDNDGDGIEDALDKCPQAAGPAVEQGCPRSRYKGVEVTARALRISEPVAFEGTSSTIRPQSLPLLDTVATALREHPQIQVEVQGHTDSQGDDAANMRLSQERAEAVRAYLIEQGVEPARLTARGYGETRPIESNRTSQGRAINRRIEFVRIDQSQ